MYPPSYRSQFQPGTWALFSILRENDRHRALFRNTGLWAALSGCVQLRGYEARAGGNAPATFLELVTAALSDFRATQAKGLPLAHLGALYVSDYDVHAFQAAASTLADVCWPDRSAADFTGPPLRICLQRLREADGEAIAWAVTQHYLGTLLQRCFNDAGIRRQVSGLVPETEAQLRSVEAKRFVVLARAAQPPSLDPDPAHRVWLAAGDFWSCLALPAP